MQAFVISLELERERRMESIRLVRQSGLPFELIEAIDGRTTPQLPCTVLNWPGLRNTEVACYLSHLRALQRLVDYGLPYATILEDDFDYLPRGGPRLAELEHELPHDFSYVCLHNVKASVNPEYEVESSRPPFQKLRVAPLVTCGYIVARPLALHVLKHHALAGSPIDHLYLALSRDRHWNFYDLIDPIICPRAVPSANW